MKKSKVGVENIKKTFSEVLNLARPVITALEDGKITLPELFAVAPKLIGIPRLVEAAKATLEEFKDLDAAEAKEIAVHFQSEFDIPNDQLEGQIEEGLFLLADSYETVLEGFTLFKRWESWAQDFKAA